MAETYITRQGDCWDAIAYRVYGDEGQAGWLMQHNFPLLDIFVFDAGVELRTPPLPESGAADGLPIWRVQT